MLKTKNSYISSKQQKVILYLLFIYICLLFIITAVFQLLGWSQDYVSYKDIFTFETLSIRRPTEPFFSLLRWINDILFQSKLLPIYIFTTLFSFLTKWKAFKTIIIEKPPYFLFLFHTICFFWIHEYTQIRASCAIAVFLLSIPDLINNENKKYIIKACLATIIHYSAVMMFVFLIYVKVFKSKTIYIILPIIGLIFAYFCSKVTGNRIQDYLLYLEKVIGLNKSGNISNFMSPLNIKYLVLLGTFIVNAYFTPKTDKVNLLLMKSMSFGLIFYYWLNPAKLPVISVRLTEFYTSVFVLYFFDNAKNYKIKEKGIIKFWAFLVVILYTIASLRTAIL